MPSEPEVISRQRCEHCRGYVLVLRDDANDQTAISHTMPVCAEFEQLCAAALAAMPGAALAVEHRCRHCGALGACVHKAPI